MTDQVISVAIPPSCAVPRQQNAVMLIWLRPGEEVNEPSLLRCLLRLSWMRTIRAKGLGKRASSCHAKPEDYDEMRCAEMMWSRASTKVCGSSCDRARTLGLGRRRS